MRLPADLAQQIDEWFYTIYRATFDKEVESVIEWGQADPDFDPEEYTIEEVRQKAIEYIESEPEHMIEPLLEECGTLERAIIVALLERHGFQRVKVSNSPDYAWIMGTIPRRDGQQAGRDHQRRRNEQERHKRSSARRRK